MTSVFDPVVHGSTVYLCVKRFSNPITGGVVAVDAVTGSTLWSTDLVPQPPNSMGGCNRSVAIAQGVVVATSAAGEIQAMDASTGVVLWSRPGPSRADSRLVAAMDSIVIVSSTDGYVTAFKATTGDQLWSATANRGSISYQLAIDARQVYVLHSGLQLAAFDLQTGVVNWLAGDGPSGGEFLWAPAVDIDRIYVGGDHGLYALRK